MKTAQPRNTHAVCLLTATLSALCLFPAVGIPADLTAPSDHYDGSVFFNAEPGHSFSDMIRWLWEMERVPWPDWIEDPVQPPPPDRVYATGLRVTYINHASVLIQTGGVNILTDPIWSMRVGPAPFLGPRRVRAPGVAMEDLPPIDYVLISHDHYDHLDVPTLRELRAAHDPTFVTGRAVGSVLGAHGIDKVIELDWWQSYRPSNACVTVTFVPARHGSGRAPFAQDRTLWGGFVIDTPAGEVYFAGDTGYGGFIEEIARKFSRIRLAILPIGNYEKRWFMKSQHMSPDDAVLTHLTLGAATSVGIHFATFAEHPEQAIDAHETDLARALRDRGVGPSRFLILSFGEGRDISPVFDSKTGVGQ
jgi:L-ascorbate metabolism protein UlaG (beta-lactamase superfamily)